MTSELTKTEHGTTKSWGTKQKKQSLVTQKIPNPLANFHKLKFFVQYQEEIGTAKII